MDALWGDNKKGSITIIFYRSITIIFYRLKIQYDLDETKRDFYFLKMGSKSWVLFFLLKIRLCKLIKKRKKVYHQPSWQELSNDREHSCRILFFTTIHCIQAFNHNEITNLNSDLYPNMHKNKTQSSKDANKLNPITPKFHASSSKHKI